MPTMATGSFSPFKIVGTDIAVVEDVPECIFALFCVAAGMQIRAFLSLYL